MKVREHFSEEFVFSLLLALTESTLQNKQKKIVIQVIAEIKMKHTQTNL